MTGKSPREADPRLADWVDGRLSAREHERFVAELRVNPQLRADLEAYERTVGVVRAALRAPGNPSPMADRVLAAIGKGQAVAAPRARPSGISWRHGWWSLASAAALLVIASWVDAWSARPATTAVATQEPPAAPAPLPEAAPTLPAAGAKELPEVMALQDTRGGLEADPSVAAPATRGGAGGGVGGESKGQEPATSTPPALGSARRGGSGDKPGAPGAPPAPAGKKGGAEPGTEAAKAPTEGEVGELQGLREALTGAADDQAGGAGQPGRQDNKVLFTRQDAAPAAAFVAFVQVEGTVPAADPALTAKAPAGAAAPAVPPLPDAGRAAEAAPAVLDAARLQLAVDTFLAQAAKSGGEAPAQQWMSTRGELTASPLVEDVLQALVRAETTGAVRPAAPRPQDAPRVAVVDRGWLVEGARPDVEVVLQRVAVFARERQWQLQSREKVLPKELQQLAAPAPSPPRAVEPGAAAADRMRVVLRILLHAR